MHLVTLKSLRLAHRIVGRFLPAGTFARSLPGIPGRVHIDDQMLASDAPEHVTHYLEDARSAIQNLSDSLARVGSSFADLESCLDFPSGYGRVTRHLARLMPPKRVTAGDVDPEAVRFCTREFGVLPFHAPRDARLLTFPRAYDLVFIGSLFTHLPLAHCEQLLRSILPALRTGGLLVFTTQGTTCLEHLHWYGLRFARHEADFRRGVSDHGAFFLPYGRHRSYGITIHSRAYIERLAARVSGQALEVVRFAERGWDRHQDVWSYRNLDS